MAKCRLILYKDTKLVPDKNFSFNGSIGDYLAGKTNKLINDFQYQRFELEKTIRVNLSQDEQILSNNQSLANRYDYCCMIPMSGVATQAAYYYYFIVKTTQISQSTIEYQLVMDTLNTFTFLTTFNTNLGYTLSPKTLVKREHKDRFSITKSFLSDDNFTNDGYPNVTPSTQLTYYIPVNYLHDLIPSTKTYDFVGWHYKIEIYNQFNNKLNNELDCSGAITFTNNGLLDMDITYTDYSTMTSQTANVRRGYKLILKLITHPNIGIAYSEFAAFITEISPRINPKLVYQRIIDEYQEGLSTQLFKVSDNTLYDEDEDNQWYVVYSSTNAVVSASGDTAPTYVNPVQVRLYSDKGYTISSATSAEVVLYPQSPIIPTFQNEEEVFNYRDSAVAPAVGTRYVKIGGTTYDFHDYIAITFERDYNSDVVFKQIKITPRLGTQFNVSDADSIIFFGINTIYCKGGIWHPQVEIFIGSGSDSYSGSCDPWNEVDLTDPKLIKAFAFPYAPMEFLVGKDYFENLPDGLIYSVGDNVIEVNNRNVKFNYQKQFDSNIMDNLFIEVSQVIPVAGQARNKLLESKLFHSDYYQPKFVYDSFAFSFNLEFMDSGEYLENFKTTSKLFVSYVISSNVQSKFMFKFDSYTTKKSIQNYHNILTIERNNEKALFNNAYINYIRSGGYSYDQKKASSQNAVNGVTTALSIVGSVASFASSSVTGGAGIAAGVGLAVGAAAGIIRSVHTAQEQDRAIAQKLTQEYMQGTSVQGSEDIDILTAFSGNKAKIVEYKLSNVMEQAMWDLFYYCGYATHEQKIPDINTRLYFNFVQAEIVFSEYKFNEDIAEDIKNKWDEGITFIHKVAGSYDIDQQYENFETSLM